MKSSSIVYCFFILIICAGAFAAAEEIAVLDGADQANFQQPDRWSFVTENGQAAVKLKAGKTSYCTVPITGTLPEEGMIMLALTLGGKPRANMFAAGVGAWGSPTKDIPSDQSGEHMITLPFPAAYAQRFVKDDKLAMLFRNSDKTDSPAILKIAFYVPEEDEIIKAYRKYIADNTKAAFSMSKTSGFKFVGKYDDGIPLSPSPEDTQRGFIPFARSYMTPVYPASIPTPRERNAEIRIRLARNESEPVQVAIKALKEQQALKLQLKSKLPRGLQAEFFWVENVPLRTKGGTSSKNWHIAPNRLWPDDLYPPLPIKKGEARAWYIVIYADAQTKAEEYSLKIALQSGAKAVHVFDIVVEVLPLELPRALDTSFGFYISNKVDESNVKMLSRSGCNSTSAWPTFVPFINGKVDFTKWDAYFALLKKYGMDHSFLWYVGTKKNGFPVLKTVGGKDNFIKILKTINAKVESGLYPRNFYITLDEAVQNKRAFSELKKLAAWMKEHSPLVKPFGVSLNRYNYTTQHKGFIDMLSCNGSFDQNARWARDNNCTMYTYTSFNARMPVGTMRFNVGFNPWRYDADGTFGWAYAWQNGNPFNDMDSWGSDWIMVFPNWTGMPVGSPAMTGWREGIDDRRYLELYAARVKAGKADRMLLDELKQFLKADYHSEETIVGDSEFKAIINDSEKMNKARSMIIEALLK